VGEKVLKQLEESLYAKIHLEVTESLEANSASLHAEWGVIAKDVELYRLGISRTANSIMRNSGQVKCSRFDCKESEHIKLKITGALKDIAEQAYCAVDMGTTKIYITQQLLSIRFAAAHGTHNPIVQGTECLSCCVLAGMRRGLKEFVVIRPDPSFDLAPRSMQLENSFLRRLGQNAGEDPLPFGTQSSRVKAIEYAVKDDNRSESPTDFFESGAAVNKGNVILQRQDSSGGDNSSENEDEDEEENEDEED